MPAVLAPSRKVSQRPNLNERINLAAWYRYRIGLTNISGACSAWADQSGNMRPLLQATAASRPTINSDGSLTFDGVDDVLAATFTLAQPLTFYIAFQQLSWTSTDVILDGVTATVKLSQETASPGIIANAGSALAVDNTIKVGSNGVACFVANSTSSVYQAGGGAASVTTSGDASTNAAGGITLGASRTPDKWANIRVYELAAYSVAHDATTRLRVMRYLSRVAQVGGI